MCMVVHPEELTPHQRGALVTYRLMRGDALTIGKVTELTGYRRPRESRRLMLRLEQILPIGQRDGVWEWLSLTK